MNLDQLEAVLAVADQGTFRAAAEFLHRSQPAISTSIKNLEDEFDLRIFDRGEYRPRLTPAGEAFLRVARAALESARYATRVARELGTHKAETQLRVSADPLLSTSFIEILALECARPLLPVQLIIDPSIFKGSYQDLLDGKIDLAFAPCPRDTDGVERIPLEEVTLIGAISKHSLKGKKRATAGELLGRPQILTYDKRIDETPVVVGLPRSASESKPGQKIFVPDHFTKLRLIEDGVGWGRISEKEFQSARHLVRIDRSLCEPLSMELCLLRAKLRPLGPTARAVWEAFLRRTSLLKGRFPNTQSESRE